MHGVLSRRALGVAPPLMSACCTAVAKGDAARSGRHWLHVVLPVAPSIAIHLPQCIVVDVATGNVARMVAGRSARSHSRTASPSGRRSAPHRGAPRPVHCRKMRVAFPAVSDRSPRKTRRGREQISSCEYPLMPGQLPNPLVAPQRCSYFLPDPHPHRSLHPVRAGIHEVTRLNQGGLMLIGGVGHR